MVKPIRYVSEEELRRVFNEKEFDARVRRGVLRTQIVKDGAPRPDAELPSPVRFLPEFDSAQLAYAARRRQRILPDAHREKVYVRANLRVLPTFLVDGMMAGTWSVDERRREATLTLQPFEKLSRTARAALTGEAERLLRFSRPAARAFHVAIAD